MKHLLTARLPAYLALVPLLFACSSEPEEEPQLPTPTEVAEADYVKADSGLKYYDIVVGDGPSPEKQQMVEVHYTGWLPDGRIFDSSVIKKRPYSFRLGTGQVIRGWDEGIETMQVGGKRQLVVPPDLAYGERGVGNAIPPNTALIFEVELLKVE